MVRRSSCGRRDRRDPRAGHARRGLALGSVSLHRGRPRSRRPESARGPHWLPGNVPDIEVTFGVRRFPPLLFFCFFAPRTRSKTKAAENAALQIKLDSSWIAFVKWKSLSIGWGFPIVLLLARTSGIVRMP